MRQGMRCEEVSAQNEMGDQGRSARDLGDTLKGVLGRHCPKGQRRPREMNEELMR